MENYEQDPEELTIEGASDFKLVRPQGISALTVSSTCLFHFHK